MSIASNTKCLSFLGARVVTAVLGKHELRDRSVYLEQVVACPRNHVFRSTKSIRGHLSLLSTGLRSAAAASAEARLQAVDKVADDGEDEHEDDDNDRYGNIARHFGGWQVEVFGWSG